MSQTFPATGLVPVPLVDLTQDELASSGVQVFFANPLTEPHLARFRAAHFAMRFYVDRDETMTRAYLFVVKDEVVRRGDGAFRGRDLYFPLLKSYFPSIFIEDSTTLSVNWTDAAKMRLIW